MASASDFFEGTYRPIKLRGKSALTLEGHREIIRVFERWWRGQDDARAALPLPIDAYNDVEIGNYLLSREDISAGTRNKQLRYLHAQAKLAFEKKQLAAPLTLKEEPEPKRKVRCWSLEELERLLAIVGTLNEPHVRLLRYRDDRIGDSPATYWWLALILLIYNTGVRISAIMSILSEDLDLQRGTVLIRAENQKDKEDQEFSLLPETISALQLIRPHRLVRIFEEWPFDRDPATRKHRKHVWGTLTDHLAKLLKASGLPTTRRDKFHKIRRTFATNICRKRGKEVTRELMGHSTQEVLDHYIDERFMEMPSVAEILDRPRIEFQLSLLKPDDKEPPSAKLG